jgi:hypothetical protein
MDYQDIIAEIVQPEVINNVVVPSMEKLYSLGTMNNNIKSGSTITDPNCIAKTAAGGAFTRSDANPESMTKDFVNPYWNKVYYHEGALVRREDLDEALEGTPLRALLQDAANDATEQLMNHVYEGCLTQIKSDIDATGAYSDGSVTRVTALASYEEATDTAITLAILRAAQNAIGLKRTTNWGEYKWLFEQEVWDIAHPLMSATGSWVENDPKGRAVDSGYLPVAKFDSIAVDTMYGMTTGDAYLFRKVDLQIQNHKGLELEWVPVDEYAYKVVARIGVNCWVRHPAWQAKLTSKD